MKQNKKFLIKVFKLLQTKQSIKTNEIRKYKYKVFLLNIIKI